MISYQVVEINNVVNIDAEDVGNPQLVSFGGVNKNLHFLPNLDIETLNKILMVQ